MYNTPMSKIDVLETQYLHQPRGPGTGWALRIRTPSTLVGKPNPKTGKPFGKDIHEGLGTRDVREARRLRDVRIGEIRILESAVPRGQKLLDRWEQYQDEVLEHREAYASMKEASESTYSDEFEQSPEYLAFEAYEGQLIDTLEDVERKTGDTEKTHRFYDIVTGKATPLNIAYDKYITEKGASLSTSTLNNLKTAYQDFTNFAGDDVTLEQCDRLMVGNFVNEYLPSLKTEKAPNGPSPATIRKKASQLGQIWRWAMDRGFIHVEALTPWDRQGPTTKEVRKASQSRRPFHPTETAALLRAAPTGKPLGDIIRIALLTGARLEEIASLEASQVDEGCQGYTIREGKTENAARYVPLVRDAQEVVSARMQRVDGQGSLFPELKTRKSTGKRGGAISQQFTRLRRDTLGPETDGELAVHALRHTWRTAARRAGVDLRTSSEMGGWSRGSATDSPYDHGLDKEHYREEQEKVANWLEERGHFGDAFHD